MPTSLTCEPISQSIRWVCRAPTWGTCRNAASFQRPNLEGRRAHASGTEGGDGQGAEAPGRVPVVVGVSQGYALRARRRRLRARRPRSCMQQHGRRSGTAGIPECLRTCPSRADQRASSVLVNERRPQGLYRPEARAEIPFVNLWWWGFKLSRNYWPTHCLQAPPSRHDVIAFRKERRPRRPRRRST